MSRNGPVWAESGLQVAGVAQARGGHLSSFSLQGAACVGAGEGGFVGPFLRKGISKVPKASLELSGYQSPCLGPAYSPVYLRGLGVPTWEMESDGEFLSEGSTAKLRYRALQM